MLLQTTLCLAAAAIIINLWHFIRIVRLRYQAKVAHGDGGHPALARRMRAQANFIEHAPLALIGIGLIELSGRGGTWLAVVGAVFMLGRVAHAIGMDREGSNAARAGGMLATLLAQITFAVACVLIATGQI